MEPKEIIRLYSGSDASMIAEANTNYGLLTADLAHFTAFDTTMTVAFLADYLEAITKAETVLSDAVIIDQMAGKTRAVSITMDKARSKYMDMKFYFMKAFANDITVQNEFGVNDYPLARRNTDEMINFLEGMYYVSLKYKPQLLAIGCPSASIDEIDTIRLELKTGNFSQDMFIKGRPVLTSDRIVLLNNCFSYMTLVNAAAQRVFKDNYAKKNQYVYNPSPADNGGGSDDEFIGTVNPGAVKTITTIDEDATIIMSNTGTEKLYFALSPTEGAGGIDFTVLPGETLNKLSSEMSPDGDGTFLLVKNPEGVIGNYEVTIEI
ncbi:MAG: hypothetical protein U0U67_02055 [Chitinophagales bacterium]